MPGIYANDGSVNVTVVAGGGGSSGGLTNTELRASAVPVSISGTASVTVSNTPLPTILNATAVTGGVLGFKVLSAASTNSTNVKASAGRIYSCQFSNSSASYRYVKFYNLATAPVVGTTPVVSIVGVPPGGRASLTSAQGIYCSAGIGFSIVGGPDDANTTAVAANDIHGSITYL